MLYYIHDPDLAKLLAGNEEGMPDPHEFRLVCSFLTVQILLLLTIGCLPW